jgi:hypothetical protein
MDPDDLKTLWLCRECGRRFAFHSDVESHKKQFNHSMMLTYNLQSGGKEPFTRGQMSIAFRLGGKASLQIIVDYEYYPSSGMINYIDVRYSNDKLRPRIEGDPAMMKNIDNYLRKSLNPKISAGL